MTTKTSTHNWLGDPRKARLIYTFRGVVYGSAMWPMFVALTFLGVSSWMARPVRTKRLDV